MSDKIQGEPVETQVLEEQTQDVQPGQSETSNEVVPEKFIGKPAAEVIRAYQELESKFGSIASERAQASKRAEDLERKLRELESQPRQYQQPQQTQQRQAQSDPLAVLDSLEWDNDPRQAIKKTIQGVTQQISRQQQEQAAFSQYNEMINYYQGQKANNPDFARREALMQQLSTQLAGIVKPEFMNSIHVMKALDLMSKGMDVSYYESQAVERAKKEGLSKREEKRNAHSESSGQASHSSGKRPKDMTVDELEAYLKSNEQDE